MQLPCPSETGVTPRSEPSVPKTDELTSARNSGQGIKMYCTTCGTMMPTVARYCQQCGNGVERSNSASPRAQGGLDARKIPGDARSGRQVDPALLLLNLGNQWISRAVKALTARGAKTTNALKVVLVGLVIFRYGQIGYTKFTARHMEGVLGDPLYWLIEIFLDCIGIYIILSAFNERSAPFWLRTDGRDGIEISEKDFKASIAISSALILLPFLLMMRGVSIVAAACAIAASFYMLVRHKEKWLLPLALIPMAVLAMSSSMSYISDALLFSFSAPVWVAPIQYYVAALFVLSILPFRSIAGRTRGDIRLQIFGGVAYAPLGSAALVAIVLHSVQSALYSIQFGIAVAGS